MNMIKKKDKIDYPVDIDTKIDGMRLWCSTDFPHTIEGYTRGNIKFPHIDFILNESFAFSEFLPPNCVIDGEIWHPDYHLNEINSIVKSEKKKDPRMERMEYHIFDIWWEEDKCQEIRRSVLELAIRKYRRQVLNYENNNIKYGNGGRIPELIGKTRLFSTLITVADNQDEIYKIHRNYVDNMGFEGCIIRRRANGTMEDSKQYNLSRYIFGKSNHIMKVIDYISEEGRCLGVLDSKGNEKGCARLVLKDIRGNIFTTKPDGPFETRRKWLKNPNLVVGKYVTFDYKQLSDHDKPLNVIAKTIRDEPGWIPDHNKEIEMDYDYKIISDK